MRTEKGNIMEKKWLSELESQIESELAKNTSAKEVAVPQTSINNNNILFSFILIIVICLGGLWMLKGNNLFNKLVKNEDSQQTKQPWEEPLTTMSSNIQGMDEKLEKISKNQQATQEMTAWIGQRLALSAAVSSNNFVELNKSIPDAKFIFPDENWKIDRLPENLILTDKDKERLGQFIRQQ